MIEVRDDKLRNVAVSGITNDDDYNLVCYICEDADSMGHWNNKYNKIVYDNKDNAIFMHNWWEQNYNYCTLVTIEQFKEALNKSISYDS